MSVLQYASVYQEAQKTYGIPASTLAALVQTESSGTEGEVSSTGARGLTQFEPGTARQYGVNTSPGHARSQILGAAHYLQDLGYAKDPAHALASYNAGPANAAAGAGYARTVLGRARAYTQLDGAAGHVQAGAGAAATGTAAKDSSTTVFGIDVGAGLLKGLLYLAMLSGAAVLILVGVTKTTGLTPPIPAAMAAKAVAKA